MSVNIKTEDGWERVAGSGLINMESLDYSDITIVQESSSKLNFTAPSDGILDIISHVTNYTLVGVKCGNNVIGAVGNTNNFRVYKGKTYTTDIDVAYVRFIPIIKTLTEKTCDYSTTELDTGAKWIDGKKIYRKVYTFINSVIFESDEWVKVPNLNIVPNTIIRCTYIKSGTIANNYNFYTSYNNGLLCRSVGYTVDTSIGDNLILEYTKTEG